MLVAVFLSVSVIANMRQTELASSLVNFWAHSKIVFIYLFYFLFIVNIVTRTRVSVC